MRDKVVNIHCSPIEFVPECYKTQKTCDKSFNKSFLAFSIFPIDIKLKKCVIIILMILFQYNVFLINIRLNNCVIKLLMIV